MYALASVSAKTIDLANVHFGFAGFIKHILSQNRVIVPCASFPANLYERHVSMI